MPSSDQFDDDDDFFANSETLNAIAAIEQRVIASSQAPKHGFHHTVVRPGTGPRAAGGSTNRTHVARKDTRSEQRAPAGRPPAIDEDSPMEFVVNEKGQYGLGAGTGVVDDDPIIDKRRPDLPLVDNASVPFRRRLDPAAVAAGSQARREAIAKEFPQRSMTRSHSSASVSVGANNAGAQAARLGPARTLARSVSAGSHVLSRNAAAGPSRAPVGLPPVLSQGSGSQPSSQGAAARRAVVGLEDERRRREAIEAENRALRARLERIEARNADAAGRGPWHDEVQADGAGGEDAEHYKKLFFAAQGETSTVRRNHETEMSRVKSEVDKLRAANSDLEAQMRSREQEAKQRIKSMKTQAVFSNHNALASASKVRQQSQWAGSQRPAPGTGAPTPHRAPASPLRDKGMVTPAPLARSAKGKGTGPPPPGFGNMTNAFTLAPTVGRKRQRTEAPSPTTTPKKGSQGRQQAASPMAVSPAQSQRSQGHSQGRMGTPDQTDMNMDIDWNADNTRPADVGPDVPPRVDPSRQLVHHLLTHVTASPLQLIDGVANEPTMHRLIVKADGSPELDHPDLPTWRDLTRDLLRLCGATSMPFHELCGELMRLFALLVDAASFSVFSGDEPMLVANLINVLRLLSASALLFPTLLPSDSEAPNTILGILHMLSARFGPDSVATIRGDLEGDEEKATSMPDDLAPAERPSALWEEELADAIVELGEAACLSDGKLWNGNQLSGLILNLLESEHPAVVGRALDLFALASCHESLFRALLFPTEGRKEVPALVDAVARFLISRRPRFTPKQVYHCTLTVLSGLSMLSRSHADAVTLMARETVLIPALLMLLHRESARVWGNTTAPTPLYPPLALVTPATILLHNLVFPLPLPPRASSQAASQASPDITGVDLGTRLADPSLSKEFNGIREVCVSTLGALAYADVDVDPWPAPPNRTPGDYQDYPSANRIKETNGTHSQDAMTDTDPLELLAHDLGLVQDLAQDLLDAVVPGPEGDQVYKMYASDEEADADKAGADDEFAEEERLMGAEWDEEDGDW